MDTCRLHSLDDSSRKKVFGFGLSTIAIFIGLSLWPSGIYSQPAPDTTSAERFISLGDRLLKEGAAGAARQAYKTALEQHGEPIGAFIGLAMVAQLENNWDEAIDRLTEAVEIDPDALEVRYLRAISYRERGKIPTHLYYHWERSSEDFAYVLQRDSLYKDVLLQFALMYRHAGDYPSAIATAADQIRLKPDLAHAHVGILAIFRHFIYLSNPREARRYLQKHPSEYSRYFEGELYRIQGDLKKAKAIFTDLHEHRQYFPIQPLLLSRARVQYAEQQPEKGQRFVEEAIATVDGIRAAMLVFEDFKYILSPAELHRYRSLTTPASYRDFFATVWETRDPTPAQDENVRLTEHYRRVLKAERDYLYPTLEYWRGTSNANGPPEFENTYYLNASFHDKGRVYIRHGEPDDWAITGTTRPNESWHYIDPRMDFHFLVTDGKVGNWRAVPLLTDREMLEDRAIWSGTYQGMMKDPDLVRDVMIRECREYIKLGFTTDRHTWGETIEPMDMSFVLAAFRGESGNSVVEIHYALPIGDLTRKIRSNTRSVDVEVGVSVHDTSWTEILSHTELNNYLPSPDESAAGIDMLRLSLPPDTVQLAFHARPVQSHLLAARKIAVRIPDFTEHSLMISDIVPAYQIRSSGGASQFTRGDLYLEVNPFSRFSIKQPLFVYFEVYNLTYGPDDKTHYLIEYTLRKIERKILGILPRESQDAIAIRVEQSGGTISPQEYAEIDVRSVEPGEYELIVNITDKNTGTSAERSLSLRLTR